MKEIWRDIKGYEGLYQISNLGSVKSLIGYSQRKKDYIKREKILKPSKAEYLHVVLFKNKVGKTMYIHKMVADAFIDNPENKTQVNHKDENKHNNCVSNLEWCTHKENMNYGSKQDRRSITSTKYNVLQYDLNGNLIKEWFNLREVILNTNYKKTNIMSCCKHKSKSAYGFKWEYKLIDSR